MFICDKNFTCCDYQYWDKKEDIDKDALECGHLVEVVEVKHGHWIPDGHHIHCSNCGIYMCDIDREGDLIPNNFCPNCGAKMDEIESE